MLSSSFTRLVGLVCVFAAFLVPVSATARDNVHYHYHQNKPNKPHKPNYKPHRPHPRPPVVKPHRPKPPVVVVKPHRPKPPVVVVKPHRPHRPGKRLKRYLRETLPRHATYAIIAGISYAIIDNIYYERRGREYIEVRRPRGY